MNKLIRSKPLAKRTFKWRTAEGEWIAPEKMETRHLFYTLRMIWNHSVPAELRVGQNIKRRAFDPEIYTEAYIKRAIRAILFELLLRPDVGESWRPEFYLILEYGQRKKLCHQN